MVLATSVIAAPIAILVAALGMQITRRRRRDKIGPGKTGDESFTRLQRAHANAIEHAPLLLVLLMLYELSGGSRRVVLILGGALVAARVMHAAGLIMKTKHPLHVAGAGITYTLEVALAVMLLRAFVLRG